MKNLGLFALLLGLGLTLGCEAEKKPAPATPVAPTTAPGDAPADPPADAPAK